jgi:voltage-gated potassium channel
LGKPLTAFRAARITCDRHDRRDGHGGGANACHRREGVPNIGDGQSWAIQTVTTVGYGDLVPTSPGGRLIAALLMLVGIALLTIIAAAITSTFIETAGLGRFVPLLRDAERSDTKLSASVRILRRRPSTTALLGLASLGPF